MTPRIARFRHLLPVGCLLVAGCSGGWSPLPAFSSPAAAPAATLAAEPFSGERAWAHLVALSSLGPRPAGSTANQEAREYIRSRLEEMGVEVQELTLLLGQRAPQNDGADAGAEGEAQTTVALSEKARHLVARIPGASPDSVMLIAHYDTLPNSPGANDGASGAAVLIELARQLSERPLPFTTEFVFLDREMVVGEDAPTEPRLEGSRIFVGHLKHSDTLDLIRLAVVFRQVGDADLTIGRDLHSHRIYREAFFDAAAALGRGDAFPTDRGYVEVFSSHRPFLKSMPRIVSIHDPWYGGDQPPGEFWGDVDLEQHCSADSLETVGTVSLAALRRISAQIEKIDRISGRADRQLREAEEAPEVTGEAVEEPPPAAATEPPPPEGAAPEEAAEAAPESS